jgi:hypothetical protein
MLLGGSMTILYFSIIILVMRNTTMRTFSDDVFTMNKIIKKREKYK